MTLDTKDVPQATPGVEEQENADEQQTWQAYAVHTTKNAYMELYKQLYYSGSCYQTHDRSVYLH